MSKATTVNVVDPRIEPPPGPVYVRTIAPKQNQYYKIPASGLSNSYITFNNMTTLGPNRAYLDTFELECHARITFNGNRVGAAKPDPDEWVFNSFPFNKCCEQARVNVNGGAFFSQPMSYVTAKERYWSEKLINDSYENICPCNKPHLQNEMSADFSSTEDVRESDIQRKMDLYSFESDTVNVSSAITDPAAYVRVRGYAAENSWGIMDKGGEAQGTAENPGQGQKMMFCQVAAEVTGAGEGQGTQIAAGYDHGHAEIALARNQAYYQTDSGPEYLSDIHLPIESTSNTVAVTRADHGAAVPTRLPVASTFFNPTASGLSGSNNNAIVRFGPSSINYRWDDDHKVLTVDVTWREPIFASPFSSRIDATYGRPLYNISTLDMAFNLQNLENMIRVAHLRGSDAYVESYRVDLVACNLCFQVCTVPPGFNVPPSITVPYRRYVPFITDYPKQNEINPAGDTITMTSGVFTMKEIPTAIWIFAAPTMNIYQSNPSDSSSTTNNGLLRHGCWVSNKGFGFLEHVNISLANTTQILNEADVPDLYRIAKANGCQDSYREWAVPDGLELRATQSSITPGKASQGMGSVLRLVPGVDIVLPDQELIPGASANNMVFQCEARFHIPSHSPNMNSYALWILFEYVGVAEIAPNHTDVNTNPLGNGAQMSYAPVVSPTTTTTTTTTNSVDGQVEGSGFWDKLKEGLRTLHGFVKDNKLISTKVAPFLSNINPALGVGVGAAANALGYGEPGLKRMRGGAVMGLGDFI